MVLLSQREGFDVLTLNKFSRLFFNAEHSCCTCCKHLKHLDEAVLSQSWSHLGATVMVTDSQPLSSLFEQSQNSKHKRNTSPTHDTNIS